VTFRKPLEERMDLRTTSDWVIRPRLLKLPGIAEVIIMGGDIKQYQVLVDPAKLQEYNVFRCSSILAVDSQDSARVGSGLSVHPGDSMRQQWYKPLRR
jgi:Cu/Ag efflux pump CusA